MISSAHICLVVSPNREVGRIRKKYTPDKKTKYRINHEIRTPQVRLIGADGEHVGVVSLSEALTIAHENELDLVEVSPAADPPVARVMDYGKFMYQQAKREREARKAQKQIEVKEIRLRPKTTDHHKSFKTRDARRWLEEGKKVRVRVRFRGREVTYPEIAIEQLMEIAKELSDISAIEQNPDREGRTMLMVLTPEKKKGTKREEEEDAEDQDTQVNIQALPPDEGR